MLTVSCGIKNVNYIKKDINYVIMLIFFVHKELIAFVGLKEDIFIALQKLLYCCSVGCVLYFE